MAIRDPGSSRRRKSIVSHATKPKAPRKKLTKEELAALAAKRAAASPFRRLTKEEMEDKYAPENLPTQAGRPVRTRPQEGQEGGTARPNDPRLNTNPDDPLRNTNSSRGGEKTGSKNPWSEHTAPQTWAREEREARAREQQETHARNQKLLSERYGDQQPDANGGAGGQDVWEQGVLGRKPQFYGETDYDEFESSLFEESMAGLSNEFGARGMMGSAAFGSAAARGKAESMRTRVGLETQEKGRRTEWERMVGFEDWARRQQSQEFQARERLGYAQLREQRSKRRQQAKQWAGDLDWKQRSAMGEKLGSLTHRTSRGITRRFGGGLPRSGMGVTGSMKQARWRQFIMNTAQGKAWEQQQRQSGSDLNWATESTQYLDPEQNKEDILGLISGFGD